MSDEAAVAEAPATQEAPEAPPDTQPGTAEPAQQGEGSPEPRKPRNAREMLRDAERRAKGLTSAQRTKPNRAGEQQPTDEKGRYAEKGEKEQDTETVAEASDKPSDVETPESEEMKDPADASGEATDSEGSQAAEPDAPEPVRVDLPDGHPWRDRGDHRMVPAHLESDFRRGMNEAVRLRQVEQREREARRKAAEMEAQVAFYRDGKANLSPEAQTIYEDLKQNYGEEAAEVFRRGELQKVEGELQTQTQAVRAEQFVTDFTKAAIPASQQWFPGWTEPEIRRALSAYGSYIQANDLDERALNGKAWRAFAAPIAMQSPRVRGAIQARQRQMAAKQKEQQAQQAQAKADEEAKRREKERLEQAAKSKAENPMGSLATQTGRSTSQKPEGGASWTQIREQARRRAKGLT